MPPPIVADFPTPMTTGWNTCTVPKQWPADAALITEVTVNSIASARADPSSVGGIYAVLNDGVVFPLLEPDLFGVYASLRWTGRIPCASVRSIVAYVVTDGAENVRVRVSFDGPGVPCYTVPRSRRVTVTGTAATAGGVGVVVTGTVPFGRKWELVSAFCALDEAAKVLTIRHKSAAGAALITSLAGIVSCTSGLALMFAGYFYAAAYATEVAVRCEMGSGEVIQFTTTTATNAKTLTYGYVYIERADASAILGAW